MMRASTTLAAGLLVKALVAQGPDLQFELCVKQFDEFRDRFNGRHTPAPDPTGTATPPDRQTLLRSLMASEIEEALSSAFIAEMLARQPAYYLDLDGQPWFSQAYCTAKNGDSGQDVMFWLVRENIRGAYKWSILSTDMRRADSLTTPFIGSRNHELGFTDLLRTERLHQHGVAPYVGPPAVAGLFAIQDALKQGDWHITDVRQVRMMLLQVPGWYAEVAYKPPPTEAGWTTSGWNIVHLERMNDEKKLRYVWDRVLGL